MADEYISKQSFNDAIREAVRKYPSTFYNGLEVARQIAHEMDAADVQPVRHGRWIDGLEVPEAERKKHPYVYLHGEKHCSVCYQEAYYDSDYGQQLFDYCPNCGAKMDKEESGV